MTVAKYIDMQSTKHNSSLSNWQQNPPVDYIPIYYDPRERHKLHVKPANFLYGWGY